MKCMMGECPEPAAFSVAIRFANKKRGYQALNPTGILQCEFHKSDPMMQEVLREMMQKLSAQMVMQYGFILTSEPVWMPLPFSPVGDTQT